MRMPQTAIEPRVQFKQSHSFSLQRACRECEEELHRKPLDIYKKSDAFASSVTSPGLIAQINTSRGSGRPLPDSALSFFESRFGHGFGQVRVHTGDNATSMAQAVNARAFTVGSDIFFGAHQYAPQTPAGRRLIAHELTHVIQQGSSSRTSTAHISNDQPASNATPLQRVPVTAGANVMVQRDVLDYVAIDPQRLVGKAWLALPRRIKAKVIDKAIEANLLLVDKFPGAISLGAVWLFVKAGLIGFWGRLKSANEDVKIKATDTVARIMAGESPDYALGLLKGLAKGFFVEGAAGIFIAVWDLLKGLKSLWNFLKGIGDAIGGFPEDIQQLLKSFQALGEELSANIGPAIDDFIAQATDPNQIKAVILGIAEKGKALAKEGGEKIADAFLAFFTKKGAEGETGEMVGSVIGQVLWEVLFAIVTAGAGAAVTAGKTAVKEAARVLSKLLGKIVGSILKLVKEIHLVFGKVVEVVKQAVTFVKGKLATIGTKLGEFLENIGKLLKRLLDNCHESKLVCELAKKIVKAHEVKWEGFTKGKLKEHFVKHGAEFGAKNSRDYLKMAEAFAAKVGPTVREHKVGNHIFKYEEATNTLFIGNVKGPNIKTMYKPRGGLAGYFEAIRDFIPTIE